MTELSKRKDVFDALGRDVRKHRQEAMRALRAAVQDYAPSTACEMLEQVMQELRTENQDREDD